MNQRRKAIVLKAYALLDRHEAGQITVKDINALYDVSHNADFISGKLTRDQILGAFLSGFEGLEGNHDGTITKEEWVSYYSDVSMGIESDTYFVAMMESCWGIVESGDSSSTKDIVKQLTATIR